jgi:hypothetical protein
VLGSAAWIGTVLPAATILVPRGTQSDLTVSLRSAVAGIDDTTAGFGPALTAAGLPTPARLARLRDAAAGIRAGRRPIVVKVAPAAERLLAASRASEIEAARAVAPRAHALPEAAAPARQTAPRVNAPEQRPRSSAPGGRSPQPQPEQPSAGPPAVEEPPASTPESGGKSPVIVAPPPIAQSAAPIVTVETPSSIGPGTAASKDTAPNAPAGGQGKHTVELDHPEPAVHGNGQANAVGQPSAGAAQGNAGGPGNGQANGQADGQANGLDQPTPAADANPGGQANGQANGPDQNNAGGQGNGNGQVLDGDPGNGNGNGNANGNGNGNGNANGNGNGKH